MIQSFVLNSGRFNKGINAPKMAWLNARGLNIAGFNANPANNMPFVAAHEEPRHEKISTSAFSAAKPGAPKEL